MDARQRMWPVKSSNSPTSTTNVTISVRLPTTIPPKNENYPNFLTVLLQMNRRKTNELTEV